MQPILLTLEEVLAIHRDQIARYGGMEGVRDWGMLHSAIAMPAMGMRGKYFHRDIFEMAAAYLFHLVNNHPFLDGNKRVGAVCAYVFLALNHVYLKADQNALAEVVLAVARSEKSKFEAADFFRAHSSPQK